MAFRHPVAPPYAVRQRAWEMAWVLVSDFGGRLTREGAEACVEIVARGEAALGWPEIGAVRRLFNAVVAERV